MATIAENLLELQQTKQNFKAGFESKGVDLTDVPFTEYPNKLEELKENLDTELTEQEEELAGLEEEVNALEDKPKSDIQYMIDQTNSCEYLFYEYKGTDLGFLKNLDTSNVTSMYQMFFRNSNLTTLDVSNFDTSKVTTMYEMFRSCELLTTLDVSNFNTSNVANMNGMFAFCYGLTSLDLSNFDTSNVTNFSTMFRDCRKLTTLDVSNFDTSKATNMSFMFDGSESAKPMELTSIVFSEKFKTNKVTSMSNMFHSCSKLTVLDLSSFTTRVVTDFSSMFSECKGLTTIIGELDLVKASNVYNMFYNCLQLENVTLTNIKKSIQLGSSTNYGTSLTNATLINTIQQLWDLTGSTSQRLTLSTTSKTNIANIYVKLITPTAEQIEADPYINNKKPCEVCDSTDEGAMTLTEYATSKNWAIA